MGVLFLTGCSLDSGGASSGDQTGNDTVINVSPTVSISAETSLTITTDQVVGVTASAGDVDGTVVQIDYIDAETNDVLNSSTSGPSYRANLSFSKPGTYIVKAAATDNDGATTISDNYVEIIVSAVPNEPANLPPTVSLINPGSRSIHVGESVALSVNAADSDGTIAKVDYIQLATSVVFGTSTSGPDFAKAITFSSAGVFTLNAIATDNDNARTISSNQIVVTVTAPVTPGNHPPTVAISPTGTKTITLGQPVALTAAAADSDGSIARVEYKLNGTGTTLASSNTGPNYSASILFSSTGTYTLKAVATDSQGAQTISSTQLVVTVNAVVTPPPTNHAPTAALSPTGTRTISAGQSVSVTASAADSDGTISKVEYKVNGTGTLLGASTSGPTYAKALLFSDAGTFVVKAVATDNQGAQTISSTQLVVTVNAVVVPPPPPPPANVPPTVAISPTGTKTITVGQSVALTATAADSDGTIAKVEYKLNGTGTALASPTTGPTYASSILFSNPGTFTLKAVATDNKGAVTISSTQLVITVNAIVVPPPPPTSQCNVSQIPAGDRLRIEHGMDTPKWMTALPAAWDEYMCKLIQLRTTSIRFAMSFETAQNGLTTKKDIVQKINGTPDSGDNPRQDCLNGDSSCPDFGLRAAIMAARRAGMSTYVVYYARYTNHGDPNINLAVLKSAQQTRDTLTEVNKQLRQTPGNTGTPLIVDGILIGNEFCGDARFWEYKCQAWSSSPTDMARNDSEAARFVDTMIIPALDVLPAGSTYVGATWCDQYQNGRLFSGMMKRLTATIGSRTPPAGFGCHMYSESAGTVKSSIQGTKALVNNFANSLRSRFPNYHPRLIVPEWGLGAGNQAMTDPSLTNSIFNAFIEGGADGIYLFATDTSWGAQWGLMNVALSANRGLNFTLLQRFSDYLRAVNMQ